MLFQNTYGWYSHKDKWMRRIITCTRAVHVQTHIRACWALHSQQYNFFSLFFFISAQRTLQTILSTIHPSISYTAHRVWWNQSLLTVADDRVDPGHIISLSQDWHRDKQAHTNTFTSHVKPPISLRCLALNYGRKPDGEPLESMGSGITCTDCSFI